MSPVPKLKVQAGNRLGLLDTDIKKTTTCSGQFPVTTWKARAGNRLHIFQHFFRLLKAGQSVVVHVVCCPRGCARDAGAYDADEGPDARAGHPQQEAGLPAPKGASER
eukprot:7980713-Alexandrium_andersonii.AAC.1